MGCRKSKDEGLMVGEDLEIATLDHVPEVTNSQVDRQKFTVVRAVFSLAIRELPAKISKWLQVIVNFLVKNGSNSGVAGVGGEDQ